MTESERDSQSDAPRLGDVVYDGLKTRILRHELPMGTPLREDEAATWFGASRLPARDALRRLEQEGLVERLGRKYAIKSYGYTEILVTYRLRAALEHLSVDLAVAAENNRAIAALDEVLTRQERAVATASRADFSALDTEFHIGLARISGNAMLASETETILNRVQLIRTREIPIDNGPAAALEDHRRILSAIRRGDARTAKAELDFHYATTVRLHAPVHTGRQEKM